MALKQFDKTYPNEGYSCPHQSLELVMPLLFDRRNPDDKCPRPKNWFDRSEGIELDQDSWYFWIMVEDGIPFHTVMIRGTSGMPGNQSYLIEWANDHARLRESPMSQKQYEYRIHYLALETRKGNEEQLVEALNEFGKDGWRLKRPYGEMSLRSTTCGDERSRTLGNDAKTGDNPEESGVQAILQRHETAGTTDSTEY